MDKVHTDIAIVVDMDKDYQLEIVNIVEEDIKEKFHLEKLEDMSKVKEDIQQEHSKNIP